LRSAFVGADAGLFGRPAQLHDTAPSLSFGAKIFAAIFVMAGDA